MCQVRISIKGVKLDEFTQSYLVAALWAWIVGEPIMLKACDNRVSMHDMSRQALRQAARDCRKFQADNANDIGTSCLKVSDGCTDTEMAGHDFWFTRNHEGVGFWEKGDWDEAAGKRLTESAHSFGETSLYVYKAGGRTLVGIE